MTAVRDLLERDLSERIEEIIKVDQVEEQSVYNEITEYVVTDRIREQYRDVLQAMADAPAEPHEGVGVWISGFFGSGKSSFAKILGYVLSDRSVLDQRATDLFKRQVGDDRIGHLLDYLNTSIPTDVIMFDIQVDRAVGPASQEITEILYTVLLRELGYAENHDIAELEIELEEEGKLDDFIALCRDVYDMEWHKARKGAQKFSRASALLHHLDPTTYPSEEAWVQSLRERGTSVSVSGFVERTFDLMARRRPGRALTFIVDEVGQYVARSAEKIENLRAIVEQFGKESKNRLKKGEIPAPVWMVVTSQEKLDEVVAAIDSKRVELAKLQDRFRYQIDMAPADIREVATRRILSKREDAVPKLQSLYADAEGQLHSACQLERTSRYGDFHQETFVDFYPYLPHYIDLSIDIMSGIRLQPGAPKQLGGSNRTIIKQVYEMLVSERTDLASKPVGVLVTLDRVFDLLEGILSSERQKDIHDIQQSLSSTSSDHHMPLRVAKALCLLEYVRDLPRTEANIAALLVDEVGQPAPKDEVQAAIDELYEGQFVRQTDEGWKLQTTEEKNWETERRALEPKPKHRHEILRETIREIFTDPKLKTYRYRNLQSFRVGISVDGTRTGDDGDLHLAIRTAEVPDDFPATVTEVRNESRDEAHRDDVYWVFALRPEIDGLITELYRSQQMVQVYDRRRAQSQITPTEASCLTDEKAQLDRLQHRLQQKVTEALSSGVGLFCGSDRPGSDLGHSLGDIITGLFDWTVPELYPKLDMGTRPLKGHEAGEILQAANLNGLSSVFYGGEDGLNLVIRDDDTFVPNPEADIAQEILGYLKSEHAYGNRDTRLGKALETRFGGIGYGWDREMIQLVLATLFRAGAIEVSFDGQHFGTYHDQRSHTPFVKNRDFKKALFTPVQPMDIRTLTQAVENYEHLTGRTIDAEKHAIQSALKAFAESELETVVPLEATAKAHGLPCLSEISAYRQTLKAIEEGTADECVRTLAGEGASLKESRDRTRRMEAAVHDDGLATLQNARLAVEQMWPAIETRMEPESHDVDADTLQELLQSEVFYEHMDEIATHADAVATAYRDVYAERHSQRATRFNEAIDQVQGQSEWADLQPDMQETVLGELASRACSELSWATESAVCTSCEATLNQIDSDLAALDELRTRAIERLRELTTPEETVEHVRVADFLNGPIADDEDLEPAIQRLRDHVQKLLSQGIRVILE